MTQRARRNQRRGNDAPWKAWIPPRWDPLFPPGLDPGQAGTHISTAPAAGLILNEGRKKI